MFFLPHSYDSFTTCHGEGLCNDDMAWIVSSVIPQIPDRCGFEMNTSTAASDAAIHPFEGPPCPLLRVLIRER